MQNIKGDSRIYLSGGGNEKQTFPLDEFFFSGLPKNGRFLYIPIALRSHALYLNASLWMKNILEAHNREDVQFEIADDLSKYPLDYLKKIDGIYIGGSNTWSLMQEIRDSGFSDVLAQYLKIGGQVYGGSAGAIIIGKRIDAQDDKSGSSFENPLGLDLLNNYSVACHFKSDQIKQPRDWVKSNNLPVICLPDETGLIIEHGIASCVGSKPCVVYNSDGAEKEINPGNSFII